MKTYKQLADESDAKVALMMWKNADPVMRLKMATLHLAISLDDRDVFGATDAIMSCDANELAAIVTNLLSQVIE